ncbi:hypothetical protein LshimejAT787_0905990 [Lyophyllum shimeji]|uniref:Uncharacterized protein n=1 Tax=Lyophyllum shimeji TaxID=47721 RepID=A0A9P3PTS3_LYOSH|nr:hypothetical protein LshimejAT787_0905990 [Lyophyllum shimeji]
MPVRTVAIDVESAQVNAQIKTLQNREDEIQKLIDGMQALKDSISEERLVLENRIRELEAERYPVNWLPSELLVVIFTVVVASSPTTCNAGRLSTMEEYGVGYVLSLVKDIMLGSEVGRTTQQAFH